MRSVLVVYARLNREPVFPRLLRRFRSSSGYETYVTKLCDQMSSSSNRCTVTLKRAAARFATLLLTRVNHVTQDVVIFLRNWLSTICGLSNGLNRLNERAPEMVLDVPIPCSSRAVIPIPSRSNSQFCDVFPFPYYSHRLFPFFLIPIPILHRGEKIDSKYSYA